MFIGFNLLLSLGLSSLVHAKYGFNHGPWITDFPEAAGAFPDVNIDLHSPYFTSPELIQEGFHNGTESPFSWDTMVRFVTDFTTRNGNWSKSMVASGRSEEDVGIPYIALSKDWTIAHGTASKVRIWIQASVHGNEPAGEEAVLALLGKFDTDKEWRDKVLNNTDIVILPRYNPDGVRYFQRKVATNFDPNRDHVMMDLKETRAVRSVLKGFDPHIAIDMHEYWALASSPTYNYTHAADGMYATAKNLNIHESIRKLSDEFIRDLSWRMLGSGLRAEPYVTRNFTPFPSPDYAVALVEASSEPRIGRNAVGLMQTLSFLLETRGIGLTTQEYQRRTASGLTMLSSIIGYAANASDFVRSTIAEARKSFIVSNEPIVVTDYTTTDIRHFKMVDTHNGSVVDLPVRFESSSPVTANLTRARPEAYLIPPAWDSIARRLEAAGVEVHQVHNPWNGPVEVLTITSATTNKHFYWERGPTTTLTTSASEQNVSLPAGSWLVSTRQRNAALAMAALEPEGINSLASFQIIPMSQWQEYPIFRIMQN